jgi:hypothetical protein
MNTLQAPRFHSSVLRLEFLFHSCKERYPVNNISVIAANIFAIVRDNGASKSKHPAQHERCLTCFIFVH